MRELAQLVVCANFIFNHLSLVVPVDHRLVFTLPKHYILTAEGDECSLDDEQPFRLEFRFSNGAIAKLCYQNTNSSATATASPLPRGRQQEVGSHEGGAGTLLVSEGNRILIRFSSSGEAGRLYSASPEENPLSSLPVELHFKTGKRAVKKEIE